MKQMMRGLFSWAVTMLGMLATSGSVRADVGMLDSPLTAAWTHCANAGELCAFHGTRSVRYSVNDAQYETTATDGIVCSASEFGLQTERRRSNRPADTGFCELASEAAMTQGSGSAPYIDVSAIPAGSPGVGTQVLVPALDSPVPSDGTGAFRTVCEYSHMSFDDPIVYPDQPGASHLHVFFGNTATNASSTAESLASSGNSTCLGGTINRTAYWVPALIDESGKPIKPVRLEPYYKSGYAGIPASAIRSFPKGLRMIAGDPHASAPQSVAYWGCRDHYIGNAPSIPSCYPGELMVMSVDFPQCWDGKNLDSSDHRSHMAYPRGGSCPSTHPVSIPVLTINVLYPSQPNPSQLRLASDVYDSAKPGGYSAHADWFDGWLPDIVDTFVSKCINPALDCHSHLLGDGRAMR